VNFSYKLIIPKKYLIPQAVLQEFLTFISINLPAKQTGRPQKDSEPLVAGMYYLLRTGCQWNALPLCFGASKTIYHRFVELVKLGAFQKIWKSFLMLYDRKNGLRLQEQSIDSNHKKSPLGGDKTGKSPVDRRKLGTKLNLAVEENGIPIGATIARANQHDTQLFIPIIDDLQNQINQSKNHYLHTDKGYSSKKNHKEAVSRNFTPVMPEKKPKNKPYKTLPKKDTKRWVVERTFSWINRFRRVFVRYERKSKYFLSMVQFTFQIMIFKKI